jgi:hypothetical protein
LRGTKPDQESGDKESISKNKPPIPSSKYKVPGSSLFNLTTDLRATTFLEAGLTPDL